MAASPKSGNGDSTSKKYRVILADDHVLVRHGLRLILEENPSLEIKGEVGDGLELLSLLNKLNADLVILDVSMPNLRGIEAISEIRRVQPWRLLPGGRGQDALGEHHEGPLSER